MISRFFFPYPLPDAGEVPLPDALAHHAFRVLRLRDGDEAVLFDGRGNEARARLLARGKGGVAAVGESRPVDRESPLELVLVQALASGEKMDWIVQKAVELGVSRIVPVQAERSVLRLAGERAAKRAEHWRQVVVAACEQSGRNRVPAVDAVSGLHDYLARRGGERRMVLAPGAAARLGILPRPACAVHVLVGPEGGWSNDERAACAAAGGMEIGLGPRVLRTETAGLAAIAAMQTLWGDF